MWSSVLRSFVGRLRDVSEAVGEAARNLGDATTIVRNFGIGAGGVLGGYYLWRMMLPDEDGAPALGEFPAPGEVPSQAPALQPEEHRPDWSASAVSRRVALGSARWPFPEPSIPGPSRPTRTIPPFISRSLPLRTDDHHAPPSTPKRGPRSEPALTREETVQGSDQAAGPALNRESSETDNPSRNSIPDLDSRDPKKILPWNAKGPKDMGDVQPSCSSSSGNIGSESEIEIRVWDYETGSFETVTLDEDDDEQSPEA